MFATLFLTIVDKCSIINVSGMLAHSLEYHKGAFPMLTNIIVLALITVAVFIIAKTEKKNLKRWVLTGRTQLKHDLKVMWLFWMEVGKNPIRIAALLAILICQRNVYGMIFMIVILLGTSYYLAKSNVLLKINWKSKEVDRILTYGMLVLAVYWIVDSFSLYTFAALIALAALVVGIIYLATTGQLSKNKAGRTEEEDGEDEEDYADESDEDEEADDEGDDDESEPTESDESEPDESESGESDESDEEPEPVPARRTRRTRTDG